jgi:hypothetical protein
LRPQALLIQQLGSVPHHPSAVGCGAVARFARAACSDTFGRRAELIQQLSSVLHHPSALGCGAVARFARAACSAFGVSPNTTELGPIGSALTRIVDPTPSVWYDAVFSGSRDTLSIGAVAKW